MAAKIILIRHGETDWNLEKRIQGGSSNPPLNQWGREQAEGLARKLENEEISAIYSTPLQRGLDTARAIARYHSGIEVVAEPSLREIEAGELEGVTLAELGSHFSRFLIDDTELWTGLVIVASAPPGVAITPFTSIMKGDVKFSLAGVIGTYIISIILIPLYGIIFVGQNFIQPLKLLLNYSVLILLPILLSQIFIRTKFDKYILKFKGAIINWGLFIVIFAVIALNKHVFFTDYKALIIMIIIFSVATFGLGILYRKIFNRIGKNKKIDTSIFIIGTIKNTGFSAATALALFGSRESFPSAIANICLVIYLIYLSIISKRTGKTRSAK